MSMKEVAGVLELKPGTVAFHKYRMMETLGVKTNAELLEYAIKRQMLSP
jgi:DNA-binding CsgD family transcriptional regulator